MADKTFYLTTPIYYPNARPHVGSAYTTIVCDVIARYKRMCGYDVAFLTGTDEHGEKLQRAAEAAGISPQEFVAEKRKLFVQLWEKLGIPVSVYPEGDADKLRFIYTDHPDHVTSVHRLLLRARTHQVDGQEIIYKKRYEGRYCVSDERYVSDNTDPVNCDVCGRPAELISEDNYFFRLSAFQARLLELYEKHPQFVRPDYRMNEVKSFVKSGLRDISISRRRLKWGIPWPDDPEQVFYVWFDALISYMTGIGYAKGENGSAKFKKYWRNDSQGEVVHMIGKDILRFHAVYWPAFIMAAYPDQPEMLPTTVFAHGWIYYEEDKMSKSKGNVIYSEPIVEALDSFGAPGNDALRYYLLRETTFGQDTSFSYDALIQRYNSDLANGLGNLGYRTVDMLRRFCGGMVPSPDSLWTEEGLNEDQMQSLNLYKSKLEALKAKARKTIESRRHFDEFRFSNGLEAVWELIAEANKFINENTPWQIAAPLTAGVELAHPETGHDYLPKISKLSQGTRTRMRDNILYSAAEVVRLASVILSPVVPTCAARLFEQVCGKRKGETIDNLKWGDLPTGIVLDAPKIVLPRLDKEKTLAKLHELADADFDRDKPKVGALREAPVQPKLADADRERGMPKEALKTVESESTKAPETLSGTGFQPVKEDTAKMAVLQKPSTDLKITIEDFAKVEMRVGEVLSAEPIPGATKLLKVMVDIGSEVRQVCAGIAEFYQPEQLVGMKVILVTNLQPRKLRGVESNGMILAATAEGQGKPILATFKEDVPKGAKLK